MVSQTTGSKDKSSSSEATPARGPGQALVKVSLVAVVAAGVGGLFIRSLAERLFGVEELVPLPAIHLRPDILFFVGPVPVSSTLLSAWLVTLSLIVMLGLALGPEQTPLRQLRRSMELLLESLYGIFRWVAGERQSPLTFSFMPLFSCT